MANTIQVKRSTGSSSPTGLAAGEIAWIDGGGGSGANGKLFIGDVADGSAQHIGGRGTGAIGGGAASSLAADDLSAGDAAVTLSTTSGNITIDATAGDSDIIFKGTDDSSDITMLTLDGSDAGHAIFNSRITAVGTSIFTNLDVSGDVDVDGTLEADAYTVAGDTLAEYIADTAGAMFASNTETGITATYQDADNTVDLVVGTLNQDTTGLAATATALATARTIGGTSFDGTANIAVSLAATATALATPRAINGTNFDGSAAITVTAAGSTLSDTVTVAKGGTGATTLTSGGVLLGSGTGAVTAMSVLANGEMIVGDGTTDPVAESGATLRTSIGCGATAGNGSLVTVGTVTSGTWAATDVGIAHGGTGASTAAAAATALGVGTGSSPQLTAINLGHASDTTIARVSAGVVSIEGVNIITANSTIDCGTF